MADVFLFSNFAVSALTQDVVPGDAVIRISPDDVSRFPNIVTGQMFPIVLADDTGAVEIVYCTARPNTGTLTVVRAKEGTGERSWPKGTVVQHTFTAGTVFAVGTIVPRGNWDAGTSYSPRDLVLSGGLSYVAVNPNVNSQPVSSSPNWQLLFNPLATASGSLLWGGQWNATATYGLGTVVLHHGALWRASQVITGTEPSFGVSNWAPFAVSASFGQLLPAYAATGTNNYAVTGVNTAPIENSIGLQLKIQIPNTNTGPCTLKVDNNVPYALRKRQGVDFAAGELIAGQVVTVTVIAGGEFIADASSAAEGVIVGLLSRIVALESDNTTQIAQISSISFALGAEQDARAALALRVSALEAALPPLTSRVSTAEGTISGHTATLADHTSRLNTAEPKISTIETSYVRGTRIVDDGNIGVTPSGSFSTAPSFVWGGAVNSYNGIVSANKARLQKNINGAWSDM